MSNHQKHAKLTRAAIGDYHRQEYAILGTTCDDIQALALKISTTLTQFNIGYVDTEHKKEDDKPEVMLPFDFHHHKTNSFKSIGKKISKDEEQYLLNRLDFVLVNGNHHNALNQMLVIDSRKDLSKKQDKITNPVIILLRDVDKTGIPEFVLEKYPQVSVFDLENEDWLVHLYEYWSNQVAPLNGLILTGGKSTRMGKDKGSIDYHGMKQRDFLYSLIAPQTESSFLSIAVDHDLKTDPLGQPFIKDKFIGLGVYGALLSAFQHNPDCAWMTVACDIPLIGKEEIAFLQQHRDSSKVATAFYNPETDFPDPLFTIWEPRAYPILLYYLSKGYSCPRKVLINSDIALLKVQDASFLKNVNTVEDFEVVRKTIGR